MKRLLHILIIAIPFVLLGWLFLEDIVPDGEKRVTYTVGQNSPYIKPIRPNDRVLPVQNTEDGDPFVTIIDEPAYFSVHAPIRSYETVELEVVFDAQEQPILEVGALHDVFAQSFDLRPLHNEIIETLDWSSVEEDGVWLYQREEIYDSIDEFWEANPDRSKIATYHYRVDSPYRIEGYQPLGAIRTINFSLRGHHKFFTYVKDEPLTIDLQFMDMNRKAGEDEVRVTLRNEKGEEVRKVVVPDDGNIDENQLSTTRTVSLNESGLPEGVYSVELSTTSDVFWRQLQTNLRYVTFSQTLHLGDTVGHLPEPVEVNFVTNAKHLVFETFHAEALQNLTLGGEAFSIDRTHEKIRGSIQATGVVKGNSPVGNVKIVGDGKFAFGEDMFFDPDPVQMSVLTDLDQREIDYVISTYQPTEGKYDWDQVTHEFALDEILNEEGVATFAFSAPLIAETQNTVRIREIHATYKKPEMTFTETLRALREFIPFGL